MQTDIMVEMEKQFALLGTHARLTRQLAEVEDQLVALLTPLVRSNPQARIEWLEGQPFVLAMGVEFPPQVLARLRENELPA